MSCESQRYKEQGWIDSIPSKDDLVIIGEFENRGRLLASSDRPWTPHDRGREFTTIFSGGAERKLGMADMHCLCTGRVRVYESVTDSGADKDRLDTRHCLSRLVLFAGDLSSMVTFSDACVDSIAQWNFVHYQSGLKSCPKCKL
jgi:hypothetical protein